MKDLHVVMKSCVRERSAPPLRFSSFLEEASSAFNVVVVSWRGRDTALSAPANDPPAMPRSPRCHRAGRFCRRICTRSLEEAPCRPEAHGMSCRKE